MVAGDFNQDGFPDLIVGDEDGTLRLLLGDGAGHFTSAGNITHLSSVASIVASDFNHDGILDLAVSDPMASSVTPAARHGSRFLSQGVVISDEDGGNKSAPGGSGL